MDLNLYWFTNAEGDVIVNDLYGTEDEAVEYAELVSKKFKQDIYVNCEEDIVYVAFY